MSVYFHSCPHTHSTMYIPKRLQEKRHGEPDQAELNNTQLSGELWGGYTGDYKTRSASVVSVVFLNVALINKDTLCCCNPREMSSVGGFILCGRSLSHCLTFSVWHMQTHLHMCAHANMMLNFALHAPLATLHVVCMSKMAKITPLGEYDQSQLQTFKLANTHAHTHTNISLSVSF